MVEHVRRRAQLTRGVDEVVVATCDAAIMDVVTQAGGKAVMTANTHERCTDRVHEAMRAAIGDIVVIVQGDEPLLLPEAVEQVAAPLLKWKDLKCTVLLSPLESQDDYTNPNIVKAACDRNGYILFLSRAAIPFFRRHGPCPVYRETGIRAFHADLLEVYSTLPETPLERAEAVDMLRLLEHGYRILGVPVEYSTVGVDHKEDIPIVEDIIRTKKGDGRTFA